MTVTIQELCCSDHGKVIPCGGITRGTKSIKVWACDVSKPHCPICGKKLA